jgi:5'-methylthioadenosine phosphorylase
MDHSTSAGIRTGIIGGSGLYDLKSIKNTKKIEINTPYGKPTEKIVTGEFNGVPVAFLSRHGSGHRLNPSEVNYRANLYALKLLGIDKLISSTAVGSLRSEIEPTDLVIPDQYIDQTFKREKTYFENGIVAHVSMASPVCPYYSNLVFRNASKLGLKVHKGGTYFNMEGPQFSSRAESHFYIRQECSVIGMTQAVEAKLARELEICFIPLAFVTDYDCWHPDTAHVTADMVVQNLKKNISNSLKLIGSVIGDMSESIPDCRCKNSLEGAIMSDLSGLSNETMTRMRPIISKYITGEN